MTKPKKRTKAYKPKYVSVNPIKKFFGGMSGDHAEHLLTTNILNHEAMAAMVQGRGDKDSWDRLCGALNIAIVMAEMGIGNEFRETLLAGQYALLECGIRSVKKGVFAFTGDELRAMNEAMSCLDAQLENSRASDVDRAADEMTRRLQHRINNVSVMAEIRKAEAAEEVQ